MLQRHGHCQGKQQCASVTAQYLADHNAEGNGGVSNLLRASPLLNDSVGASQDTGRKSRALKALKACVCVTRVSFISSTNPSIDPSVRPSVSLSVRPSTHPPTHPSCAVFPSRAHALPRLAGGDERRGGAHQQGATGSAQGGVLSEEQQGEQVRGDHLWK